MVLSAEEANRRFGLETVTKNAETYATCSGLSWKNNSAGADTAGATAVEYHSGLSMLCFNDAGILS
jgi:hypothetical protein